jgi:hypothetical protein
MFLEIISRKLLPVVIALNAAGLPTAYSSEVIPWRYARWFRVRIRGEIRIKVTIMMLAEGDGDSLVRFLDVAVGILVRGFLEFW